MVIKRILIILLLLPLIGLGQNQEALLSSNIKHLERAKKEIISIKSKYDLFGSCVADSCKEALKRNPEVSFLMKINDKLDGKKTYSKIISRYFHPNGVIRQVTILAENYQLNYEILYEAHIASDGKITSEGFSFYNKKQQYFIDFQE